MFTSRACPRHLSFSRRDWTGTMSTTSAPTVQVLTLSCDSAGMQAWAATRDHVVNELGRGAVGVPSGDVRVWRLLAANNREVARGSEAFDDARSAWSHVVSAQRRSNALLMLTFHGPQAATHGWAAVAGGRLVMTCSRWYETASISLEVAAVARQLLQVVTVPRARQ